MFVRVTLDFLEAGGECVSILTSQSTTPNLASNDVLVVLRLRGSNFGYVTIMFVACFY